MMLTRSTVPYPSKMLRTESSVEVKLKLPTKIFFKQRLLTVLDTGLARLEGADAGRTDAGL
jgi:hypothetical protein